MPFGDDLRQKTIRGVLEIITVLQGDLRMENVHITIELAGIREAGSYITVRFAKPHSADPIMWGLIDLKESDDQAKQLSSMLMLRRRGDAQPTTSMKTIEDMSEIQQEFDQIVRFFSE